MSQTKVEQIENFLLAHPNTPFTYADIISALDLQVSPAWGSELTNKAIVLINTQFPGSVTKSRDTHHKPFHPGIPLTITYTPPPPPPEPVKTRRPRWT